MLILLTGGRGFLGAWTLARALAGGHRVRVFDTADDRRLAAAVAGPAAATALDWVVGDIRDAAAVARAARGCDAIVHLAGVLTTDCRANPIRGAEIDLIGTLCVFEAALAAGIDRVVYSSSAGVFAPGDGARPRPLTHYGAFKLACEGSARAYFEDHGLASIGFRPAIVYGPGRESGLTAAPSICVAEALAGRPATIGWTGPTGFVFVDDVAAALIAAVVRPPDGVHVFNLPGEVATAEAMAEELARQIPGAAVTVAGPPLSLPADLAADDLDRILPGLPKTSLAEGLARTIAFHRARAAA